MIAYDRCERYHYDDGMWGLEYGIRGLDSVPTALRPPNPFYPERERFLEALRLNYSDKLALRGFHCTRLTDFEVAVIRATGMVPPNAAILRRRISEIERAGLISAKITERLISENYAAEPTRADKIWFVFTASSLNDRLGVERLFRSWGGEALYAGHEHDLETGPALKRIGTPRIIEAYVPVCYMPWHAFPGRQFVQHFLAAHGVSVLDTGFENRTTRPLGATQIRRIISRFDPGFELLTGCTEWTSPL